MYTLRMKQEQTIRELLRFLYDEKVSPGVYSRLMEILKGWREGSVSADSPAEREISERDAFLISYGDMLSPPEGGGGEGETGLSRLSRFLSKWNRGAFSFLHILPFHPYSSDDGFSVIDYREVAPQFGGWDDIAELGSNFKMVFDFVLNHGSVQSSWFKGFLAGDDRYEGWYITRPKDYNSSKVIRPRTHPLLTPFVKADGSTVYVWTTFSADQVDYDFSNPRVLLECVRLLLEYVRRGGRIIRLDAIAYLWKEDGTSCLHHPRTHGVVKLFRAIIDLLDLDTRILTETNVPHRENISYFGNLAASSGRACGDEAHMVYNFALPPLTLHAMISGDSGPLRAWAKTLPPPESGQRFLNFLASHDGVGLTPARGLVDEAAFARTIAEAKNRGALVSYKTTDEGPVPYELNCSFVSVSAPASLGNEEIRSRAFLASQAILLSLAGLPAVYFHSWIGSEAWEEGPRTLGYNRAINREKPAIDRVEEELNRPQSFRSRVYRGFAGLLDFRRKEQAFNPDSPQEILDTPPPVFALIRGPDRSGRRVLCMQNIRGEPAAFSLSGLSGGAGGGLETEIRLEPWETRWIAFGAGEKREFSTMQHV
jgi:sucrose phosphorylase